MNEDDKLAAWRMTDELMESVQSVREVFLESSVTKDGLIDVAQLC
jgi:hypothetical protein